MKWLFNIQSTNVVTKSRYNAISKKTKWGNRVLRWIVGVLCLVIIINVWSNQKAFGAEKQHYIGLHDRLLNFNQNEIVLVEGKLFVPFEKLMSYLYAEVTENDKKIYAQKNGFIIQYNFETGKTALHDEEHSEAPIRLINGELYVDVDYVVRSFGFHYHYLEQVNVYRITSDTYKSLNVLDYEEKVRKALKIPDAYIGLHDRLLNFTQEEIRLINGKRFVPFDKLMMYLYANVTKNAKIVALKNGHVISYDRKTAKTTANKIESPDQPIRELHGKLYADVEYVAKNFGFHFDYFSKINTSRISSDTYKSLKSEAYEKHIAARLQKKNTVKKPSKPTPQKTTKPPKANVYLTFDDGPNASTTTNLATLKKYNIQGTFFFVGKQMTAYPALVRQTAKEGHYVGTHSMTHDRTKVYRSTDAFMNEMNTAVSTLEKLIGSKSELLRVPYGSVPHITPAMRTALKNKNYKMWDWDVDSNDWRYSANQFTEVAANVRNGVTKSHRAGDREIVVLLHDLPQTTKALPHIIEWLKKEGYTIKKYDPATHVVQNFRKDSGL